MADEHNSVSLANGLFLATAPFVAILILIWFIIAFFANVYIIDRATGAQTLQRKGNKRVYNLVENLCISCGMTMPKVHVIEDPALNAFASGVSQKSYTVTLTRGIIDKLDDKELEGVIAHELMHIRNNDVRVLVISIVFVGIFAMLAQISMRMLASSSRRVGRRSKNDGAGALLIMLLVIVLVTIGYGVSMLMRFAISRKREYMADAGAVELTKNPHALANALRKVSGNSVLEKEQCESIAQLFIEHEQPKKGFKAMLSGLFATHPPILKRIATLEQF
ncbi:MAG: M48 family metallopeptidase [Fibromonadaceae bacterium]|nr:M48 family metallopeptidase [Fibromonadaceae bacterium]